MREFLAGMIAGFLFLVACIAFAVYMAPRRVAPKAPCVIGEPPKAVTL